MMDENIKKLLRVFGNDPNVLSTLVNELVTAQETAIARRANQSVEVVFDEHGYTTHINTKVGRRFRKPSEGVTK